MFVRLSLTIKGYLLTYLKALELVTTSLHMKSYFRGVSYTR